MGIIAFSRVSFATSVVIPHLYLASFCIKLYNLPEPEFVSLDRRDGVLVVRPNGNKFTDHEHIVGDVKPPALPGLVLLVKLCDRDLGGRRSASITLGSDQRPPCFHT